MQIGTYGDLALAVLILILFNQIYLLLKKGVQLLGQIDESLQRGLHKKIMENIHEQSQGELDALLMKDKLKEARRKAGEPEDEE